MNKQDFDFDKMFGSKFLKASDLPDDSDLVLTIENWDIEPLGELKEDKLVVSFRETDKRLTLNATNAKTLSSLFGSDPDAWIGKKIAVFQTEVTFAGKQTMGLRIRLRVPKAPVKVTKQPVPELFEEQEPEAY